jgi:hypothetical protein
MKKYAWFIMLAFAMACRTVPDNVLYQSDEFTVYTNKVVQGKYESVVVSPGEIRSNYVSASSRQFSRLVKFKVSINEKDNEMMPGNDHWVVIGDEHESAIKTFGTTDGALPQQDAGFLPPNYEYTFRINMAPVLRQFAERGYYEAFDGTKVAKADFKGFFLAGGSEPLSWDFVNLEEKGLQLKSANNDSIYSLTVNLNPLSAEDTAARTWKLSKDISSKPSYKSDQPIVDALFNLSLEEALKNIEPDTTFRTGAKWGGVWTRDISYSILLAFAYHEPEVAKHSLMKKVKRRRIIQDTGSGGAWPVSSDRTTWALAAWEIYKTTGDTAWLRNAYEIIKNTLDDDDKVIRNSSTGLFCGESSFLDWREQTYPKWMDNKDIYMSQNLGTNAVHYQAHRILANMAEILGEPAGNYNQRADEIRKGMNQYLWMKDKGYYGQYLYGRNGDKLSSRFEALGEALSVLFGVADAEQAQSIFEKSPITPFGTTCIYPQIAGIPPYHNNAIWPFVQSYWNLAAAKAGNEKALNHGLAAIYRAGAMFLTNYENFVAENGDYAGTEINSDRMLWSMAGNLAMVHRVFMGMQFETNGIRFSPAVPKAYKGKKTLSNFHYRNATLDISVNGTGNKIASFKLDGKKSSDAFVSADLTGKHVVEIELDNQPFDKQTVNRVANKFSLPEPQLTLTKNQISWQPISGARQYVIYRNEAKLQTTSEAKFNIADEHVAEYRISAMDADETESFTSEPVWYGAKPIQVEMEQQVAKSVLPYTGFSGNGFIEISNTKNKVITLRVEVAEAGNYLVDFRYANGSGPWNTDNKCALRSLYANDQYAGTFVFPQRGKDEWSEWGYSNSRLMALNKGSNQLRLVLEPWNTNMNVDVNTAMLDYLRLQKMP